MDISPKERHYTVGEIVKYEEDQCHEFKGHRSISVHDIPNICIGGDGARERSRNAVSNTICAMLNSGHGGTIYIGINDNGVVHGLSLTRYQQDHIEASVEWTVSKYSPPVPHSQYSICFVPVLSSQTTQHPQVIVDSSRRNQPHHVAYANYCWCDHDAVARLNLGKAPKLYVVEIHIQPWDPHKIPCNPHWPASAPVPPIYLNEAKICYIRQTCRQPTMCLDDIRRLLVHRVDEHYKLKTSALQHQVKALRELALARGINLAQNDVAKGAPVEK